MNRRLLVLGLLLMGLAGSLFVAEQRMKVERADKAVEIVMDYDEIAQLAAATGKSPVDVMKQFKDAGATSVAVTEETFGDSVRDGNVVVNGTTYNVYGDSERIARSLRAELPHTTVGIVFSPYGGAAKGPGNLLVEGNPPLGYLEKLPIGLPEESLQQAGQAGMHVIARLVNYPGATPDTISVKLKEIKSQGVQTIVFYGDEVLGYKGSVIATAKAIADNGLYVGGVEFSKQKGDQKLGEKSVANTVVVHSISADEMPKLTKPELVDRFQKAVRERGVRVCYVRMFETSSKDILGDNVSYVSEVVKAIKKAGYEMGPAQPIGEVQAPRALRAVAGLGVAAGALLLILSLVELSATAMIWWAVGLIVVCAGMAGAAEIGRKAVALLSAMVFPTLAVINATKSAPKAPEAAPNLVMRTLGRFVMAVLTVSAGGMLIVGLLSERSFMLRVDQFLGVKLAHLMPVLVLAVVYAGGVAWKSAKWGAQKHLLVRRVKDAISDPVLVWQAAALMVVLAIVGLMVARSGNDSGLGVSQTELKFRAILDKVLYVRPRTKEFLIGYPSLILGIALALRGMRQYAAPLVILGSIGLVSALNTFCHIHTPIMLSLLRVVNGMVVGGLIGLVVLKIVVRGRGK